MHWRPSTLRELSSLALGREDVHVWSWSLHPEDLPAEYSELLSSAELFHLSQLRFEEDRARYLTSHVNLRLILGSYLKIAARDLSFEVSNFGKPQLSMQRTILQFNLSHSDSTGLLAVSQGILLGVDVEDIRNIDEGLAKAFFSQSEQSALSGLTRSDWLHGFFRCWTRKEAILKAKGSGLNLNLDSFDVTLSPDTPAELLQHRPAANLSRHWSLQHLEPTEGLVGALATEREASVSCLQLVRER